jgi:hypothetical protein
MGFSPAPIWVAIPMGAGAASAHDVAGVPNSNPKEADMPNGLYPVPQFHSYAERSHSGRPSVLLRLKTWWQRDRLDERLAEGASRNDGPELSLRSRQLVSESERLDLARMFEAAVRDASAPLSRPTAARPVQWPQVVDSADDLLALAQRLRDGRPVEARGVAMARRLVIDPASPMYDRDAVVTLQYAIRSARLALDPGGTDHSTIAAAA